MSDVTVREFFADEAIKKSLGLTRIPLTIVAPLGEVTGVLVAVLASDLDKLEAIAVNAYEAISDLRLPTATLQRIWDKA